MKGEAPGQGCPEQMVRAGLEEGTKVHRDARGVPELLPIVRLPTGACPY